MILMTDSIFHKCNNLPQDIDICIADEFPILGIYKESDDGKIDMSVHLYVDYCPYCGKYLRSCNGNLLD
jgi:hypothetical protein